jgi:hypothetical protein
VEVFSDTILLVTYFLAWVLLLPAAIFLVVGFRNHAGFTVTIGGMFLIASALCFYFTLYSFNQPANNLRFPWEDSPEEYGDSAKEANRLFNKPKDTTMIRVSIGNFNFGVRIDGAKTFQNEDTVFIDATGLFPNDHPLQFSSAKLHDLTIEQASDHVISIHGDGPHCDPEKWNNYIGPWEKLGVDENGNYIPTLYSESTYSTPLEIDIKELKEYATVHCGKQFEETINAIKKTGEYPCSIHLNHVFFRLKGIDENGKEQVMYICIRMAFGC